MYEFGSFQVEGQEGYANLRGMFPGKVYVGCDMRPGPGVDRVEDVSAINEPDGSASGGWRRGGKSGVGKSDVGSSFRARMMN